MFITINPPSAKSKTSGDSRYVLYKKGALEHGCDRGIELVKQGSQ